MTSPNGTAGVGKWIVEKLSHGSRKPVHTTFSLSGEETCFTLCHTMVPFAVYRHLSSLSKALTPGSKLATFISHEGTVIFLFFPTLPLHCTVPQAKKHRKKIYGRSQCSHGVVQRGTKLKSSCEEEELIALLEFGTRSRIG